MSDEALNLFPARVAIGKTGDGSPVYASPEFSRALAALFVRVGGPVAPSLTDLATELALSGAFPGEALFEAVEQLETHIAALPVPSPGAAGALEAHIAALPTPFPAASLLAAVGELEARIAALTSQAAALSELAKRVADAELGSVGAATPTDWEHPGKIGASKPNSGAFTSVNKVQITAPANSATLTIADGKTLKADNTLELAGTDGTKMTFPATSASVARTDAAQTFTGNQTFQNDVTIGTGAGVAQQHINGGTGLGEGPRVRLLRGGAFKGSIGLDAPVIGTNSDDITLYSAANNINFWAGGLPSATVDTNGVSVKGGARLLTTLNALTNFSAAATATLTNAPTAGNPTKWVAINDQGTVRYLPLW